MLNKKIVAGLAVLFLVGAGIFWFAFPAQEDSLTSVKIGNEVGDLAPDFVITTINNQQLASSSFKDQVVVITSSAAWCPTCVMEAQQFSSVYQRYRDAAVVFITVDIDSRDSRDFIQQFKLDNKTPWYYTDSQGGAELIQKYNLNRFEITYIIDKKGIIRFKDKVITSADKLSQEIQKLL